MCSPFMNNQTSSLSFSLHQCLQDEFFHCVCLYLLAYFHLFLDKLMLNWLFGKLGRCFYAIFFLFFLLNCLSLTSLLYINLLVLLYPRCIIWLIYRVVWSFCTQNLWWWRFVMLSPSYGYIARRLRSFRLSCLLQGLSYTWDRQILSLQLPYNKNNRENELILYSRIVITY